MRTATSQSSISVFPKAMARRRDRSCPVMLRVDGGRLALPCPSLVQMQAEFSWCDLLLNKDRPYRLRSCRTRAADLHFIRATFGVWPAIAFFIGVKSAPVFCKLQQGPQA
jgi:hypothetical protein